jgi:molybdate transport system ATP-binding protein
LPSGLAIELRRLDLHRSGRHVLRAIDWSLRPGQRWVLVGANGAGKTQLLKILAGAIWPDPATTGRQPWRYRWFGPSAGGWLTDMSEVLGEFAYLGPEKQDRYARYEWNFPVVNLVATGCDRVEIPDRPVTAGQARQAHRLLHLLGIESLAERRFLELSSGERRLVLLARALASRPRWLLLDETLTHLDAANQDRLLDWLASPDAGRRSWVLATHRRDHIPSTATHALVLARGRVLAAGSLRAPAVGHALASMLGETTTRSRPIRTAAGGRGGELLLAVRHGAVWLEGQLIAGDIELELRAGECWVLTGANGSGKTTLLRALYGDLPFALGSQVRRVGIAPGEPLQNFRERCGFVAPHTQTDYPRQTSVLDTVLSGWESSYGLGDKAGVPAQRAARRALREWRLMSFASRPLAELSYGQARRVLFARAWLRQPRVLLLDEPFAGLDVRQKISVATRIEALRRRGAAVLLATHHDDEWPAVHTGTLALIDRRLQRSR